MKNISFVLIMSLLCIMLVSCGGHNTASKNEISQLTTLLEDVSVNDAVYEITIGKTCGDNTYVLEFRSDKDEEYFSKTSVYLLSNGMSDGKDYKLWSDKEDYPLEKYYSKDEILQSLRHLHVLE